VIALLLRDLKLAVRAGGGFGLGLAFFLIVTVLVPFGVGPDTALLTRIAPGVLWIGALLACLLSLDRILALDWEDGSLDLLATAPLPMEGIVTVKALAHWITTGLPLVLAAPVLGVLLNLPGPGYLWLVVSLALGTPALSDAVVAAMEGRQGCLMANHGATTTGETIERALWRMEELEHLARTYILSRMAGAPHILSDAEIEETLAAFEDYGLRRLP